MWQNLELENFMFMQSCVYVLCEMCLKCFQLVGSSLIQLMSRKNNQAQYTKFDVYSHKYPKGRFE